MVTANYKVTRIVDNGHNKRVEFVPVLDPGTEAEPNNQRHVDTPSALVGGMFSLVFDDPAEAGQFAMDQVVELSVLPATVQE